MSIYLLSALQVQKLRDMGQDPYAYKYNKTHTLAQLDEQYHDLPNGKMAEDNVTVCVAGRIRARRFMGKLAFATLADDSGEIQLYLERTALDATAPDSFKYAPETSVYACMHAGSACVSVRLSCVAACLADEPRLACANRHLKTFLDIGDIVGVSGPMKRTDKGELSVAVQDLQVCPPLPVLLTTKHCILEISLRNSTYTGCRGIMLCSACAFIMQRAHVGPKPMTCAMSTCYASLCLPV